MSQTSLLAHLYPYFKGSQEDVATSSLNYIVSSNLLLNRTFVKHIGEVLSANLAEEYQFKCQAVGENSERPDMAGYDERGNEKILCESKFYAALTINQPNEYLSRLVKNNGNGLVFICPEIRKRGLWVEIITILKQKFEYTIINEYCVEIDNSVRLGITTWKAVLDSLEHVAIIEVPQSLSDIKQLQGYCQQLDSDAFVPFSKEDLGADVAVKEERHYRLLDELTESIRNEPGHKVSLKRLRATPVWAGYRRYLMIDDFAVTIEYDTRKWKDPNSMVTPYWLTIKKLINGHWDTDETCKNALMKIGVDKKNDGSIALVPLCYVALSEIVEDMKNQVFEYIRVYSTAE